ncbi:hypothetical protein [Oscillibacter sp.]|uniref:hypothetical protein n=1 Tax=Oscillibacter sp. TaxID=1945593 RepID=UPI001B5767EF|nr:hypothetical protein [Oscillibacter sp.]MBP3510392.1 hypothetical protein [Oscillibacter sp.]
MQALFFIYFFPESAYTESIRLSIYPQELRDRKEDGYERLRPQAQFGAQPPQAALSAEITQEGAQGELPRSGKRVWPGPFVFDHKFSEHFKFRNLAAAWRNAFSTS